MSHKKFSYIWNILNYYSIFIFQSVIPTRLMKLGAIAFFQCAKDDIKMLSNTLEPDILQKNICFYAGNKARV